VGGSPGALAAVQESAAAAAGRSPARRERGGRRQNRSLAHSLRRTAPAWRRFLPGELSGGAAPPSLLPGSLARSFDLLLAPSVQPQGERRDGGSGVGAASAGIFRGEGEVASGCCPRWTTGGRGESDQPAPEEARPPGVSGREERPPRRAPPPSASPRARQTLEEEGGKRRAGEGVLARGKPHAPRFTSAGTHTSPPRKPQTARADRSTRRTHCLAHAASRRERPWAIKLGLIFVPLN
jgi:hypothetical protein